MKFVRQLNSNFLHIITINIFLRIQLSWIVFFNEKHSTVVPKSSARALNSQILSWYNKWPRLSHIKGLHRCWCILWKYRKWTRRRYNILTVKGGAAENSSRFVFVSYRKESVRLIENDSVVLLLAEGSFDEIWECSWVNSPRKRVWSWLFIVEKMGQKCAYQSV